MEKNYKPDFKWGKDEAGNPCITDNGSIAAKFYGGTDRLPEDKSAALRPVSLHALRLAPGGPAMIDEGETCGPLCLSWRKHLIFNMEVEELKTDDTDPECFKLFVRTMDTALRLDRRDVKNYKPGNIIEETYLELFYDAVLGSYVYDVRTSLKIKPGREEFVLANDLRGLEFGDILPSGAFDNFPPLGDKKYTHIVYKGADGRLYNRPQNRHLGPDKRNIFYSPDGFLAFVAEKHGNPVVQFLDGSGSLLWSEICWAMYDVHFKCNKDMEIQHIKKGIPLGIRYKLYSVSHREAEHMLASSSPDPVLSHPLVRCPVFSGRETNYFEPSEEYLKPSDKWFWQMSETSCFWDWKTGFSKKGSLSILREETDQPGQGKSQWELYTIGKIFPLEGKYEIKVKVKTENVKGKAYMAWQYQDFSSESRGIEPDEHGMEISKAVSGTNDWMELSILTVENTKGFFPCLYLVLEGTGKCWFDEVHIRQL